MKTSFSRTRSEERFQSSDSGLYATPTPRSIFSIWLSVILIINHNQLLVYEFCSLIKTKRGHRTASSQTFAEHLTNPLDIDNLLRIARQLTDESVVQRLAFTVFKFQCSHPTARRARGPVVDTAFNGAKSKPYLKAASVTKNLTRPLLREVGLPVAVNKLLGLSKRPTTSPEQILLPKE